MDAEVHNVKTVKVCADQAYTWGIIENKFGKVKKATQVEYYFNGPIWDRLLKTMQDLQMPSRTISFYKGANINELKKTVEIRGGFVRDVVADKHHYLWRKFFKCSEDESPIFAFRGDIVKLPYISPDNREGNDRLSFFVNGRNVNEALIEETDELPEE